jgi:hypothetical protein
VARILKGELVMNTYAIVRRRAWKTEAELERAAGRSSRVGNEEMPERVRWIRSYVYREDDGSFGAVSIYEAIDRAAAFEHAERANLPCHEVLPVTRTVIIADDPPPCRGQLSGFERRTQS